MGTSRDRFYTILCAVLVIASVLATVPALEMGTNDDWSYTWVACGLANTGHFAYNGWVAAMIGVQAVWAAALIHLFGFSFTLVRLSTLPFAAGCAVLLYNLGRRTGLNPRFALFGALSITLSPVFIPLSASFMTDIPGCFFWLASAYCALRAVETTVPARARGWMAAVAALGVAGGTIRQVDWFIPLLALPAAAWIRRKERLTMICTVALWCASALAIALCVRWFIAQPYAVMPGSHEPRPWLDILEDTLETCLQIVVGCAVLILPVLALHFVAWRKWLRAPFRLALGLLISGALLGTLLWFFEDDLLLGNIVTTSTMLGSLDLPGNKPEVLTNPILWLLGLALFAAIGVTLAMLLVNFKPRPEPVRPESGPVRELLWLLGPSCLFYALAVGYRSVTDMLLFDRYFILLLPLLVIPLLWHFQRRIQTTPPAWGWTMIGLFALYGIALTHDYLATGRARVRAAAAVTAAGIPRTLISAGMEFDAWTQLEQTGYMPPQRIRPFPVNPPFWFWRKTPNVQPLYIVTTSPLAGLIDSPFPPISYTAWLPPFRREVFTQKAAR